MTERIEHGRQLRAARVTLGLTPTELGTRLRLRGQPGNRIDDMEKGERPISGPVAVAVELMLDVKARREAEDRLREDASL
jgi:hypothetical protein